jgi:hypothetical protein
MLPATRDLDATSVEPPIDVCAPAGSDGLDGGRAFCDDARICGIERNSKPVDAAWLA